MYLHRNIIFAFIVDTFLRMLCVRIFSTEDSNLQVYCVEYIFFLEMTLITRSIFLLKYHMETRPIIIIAQCLQEAFGFSEKQKLSFQFYDWRIMLKYKKEHPYFWKISPSKGKDHGQLVPKSHMSPFYSHRFEVLGKHGWLWFVRERWSKPYFL